MKPKARENEESHIEHFDFVTKPKSKNLKHLSNFGSTNLKM